MRCLINDDGQPSFHRIAPRQQHLRLTEVAPGDAAAATAEHHSTAIGTTPLIPTCGDDDDDDGSLSRRAGQRDEDDGRPRKVPRHDTTARPTEDLQIMDGRSMATKRHRGEETTSDDDAKHQRREDLTREPETIIIQQTAAVDPPTAHSATDMAMEHGTRGVATGDTAATATGQVVAAEATTVLGEPAGTEPDQLQLQAEQSGQQEETKPKKKKKKRKNGRGGRSNDQRAHATTD